MKEKAKRWMVLGLVLLFCISVLGGCGEETSSSQETESKEEESAEPEYEYEEFISTQEPDLSTITALEGTKESAKERQKQYKKIQKKVSAAEKKYIKEYGSITEENLYYCLQSVGEAVRELYENGDIAGYKIERTCISITLNAGGGYIYSPEMEGYDAGTGSNSAKMQIGTYQPFLSSYPKELEKEMKFVDESATLVSNTFPMYEFQSDGSSNDSDYNDAEVDFSSIVRFSKYNLILWHGHGGHSEDYGSFIATGVKSNEANDQKYEKGIKSGELLQSDSGYYLITKKYIENHFTDNSLKNSIIYLGTCSSAYDATLVQALLDKGAMAVYGNNGTIHTQRNLAMIRAVSEALTKKTSNGRYYTAEEALEYAMELNGDYDTNGTETLLYTASDRGNVSLDWYEDYVITERDVVLVLDRSGSMSGEPLEQTKEAASKFVDTVMEKSSRVSLVTYDNEAWVDVGLSRRGTVVKDAANEMTADGGTNIYDGMEKADQLLTNSKAKKKIIMLMTDGCPTSGVTDEQELIQYGEQLKDKGYYVYTLGFFNALDSEEKSFAQSLLGGIASPGYHYEVTNAEDLQFFFDDIANQIGGTRYIYVHIACPVNVSVKKDGETLCSAEEDMNTRTSFGTLTFEGDENEEKILRLKEDEGYEIQIEGYDEGTMDYTVKYPDENGEYTDTRTFSNVEITDSTKIASDTASSEATTMQIDEDGDGDYELTLKAEENSEGEEYEDHTILYVVLISVSAVVVLTILILIIVFSRRSKKKRKLSDSIDDEIAPPAKDGSLTGLFGAFNGKTYPLPVNATCIIGRDSTCQIQIKHKKVSRVHCSVQRTPEGDYIVTDFSKNGTYYNNDRLIYEQPCRIPAGGLLVIGNPDNVIHLDE